MVGNIFFGIGEGEKSASGRRKMVGNCKEEGAMCECDNDIQVSRFLLRFDTL